MRLRVLLDQQACPPIGEGPGDGQPATLEIDVAPPECAQLSSTSAGDGRQANEASEVRISPFAAFENPLNFQGRGNHRLPLGDARWAGLRHGVRRYPLPADRLVEQHPKQGVDVLDALRSQGLRAPDPTVELGVVEVDVNRA